MKKLNYLG